MKKISAIFWPIIFGIIVLSLWEFEIFHLILNLKPYQLPIVSKIFETLMDEFDVLLSHALYTGMEAVIGLVLGSVIGYGIAIVASKYPNVGAPFMTLIIGINSIPIIALAPIMNVWLGNGIGSRVAVVTIATIATMAIISYKGLKDIPRFSVDLLSIYNASEFQKIIKLRIPNSIPFIFLAVKMNTTAAMIAAIASEFFYSSKGLGYMISNSIKIGKMSIGWSGIIFAAIIGIILYYLVSFFEKKLVRGKEVTR